MGSATVALFGFGPGFGDVAGTLKFWEGIGDGSDVNIFSRFLESGVIDLNHIGVGEDARLKFFEGGDGTIINGGSVEGIIQLGGPGEATFTGSAFFEEAAAGSSVAFYGDGILEFTGLFNGNLCGVVDETTLSVDDPLPANIYLAGAGSQAKICGTNACSSAFLTDPSGFDKTRFISFSTSDDKERSIRVRLSKLHDVDPPYTGGNSNPCAGCPDQTCGSCEGQVRYVGPPVQYFEYGNTGIPLYVSKLQCAPHYQDWSTVNLLHVTGSAILPSSEYEIERMLGENSACSKELTAKTTRWGDVEEPFSPPSASVQPDVSDISALVNKYKGLSGAPIKARAMLAGIDQYGNINLAMDVDFTHISACLDAFRGLPYPNNLEICP